MDLIDGSPLESVWDEFDDGAKERVVRDIWEVAQKLRQIPRPPVFQSSVPVRR
jgi:hypothetical protein